MTLEDRQLGMNVDISRRDFLNGASVALGASMLGEGGFEPTRDIAAITVNRWPHGYAYGCDAQTGRVAFDESVAGFRKDLGAGQSTFWQYQYCRLRCGVQCDDRVCH
jgi:hypothetical protein